MGLRGPAPRPTALKLLSGTVRKDRAAVSEPKPPPVETAKPPAGLPLAVRNVWKARAPRLIELGLLTLNDLDTFRLYCEAWVEKGELEREIKKVGKTYVLNGCVMKRPECGMLEACLARLQKLGARFGMAPSDRTRINAPAPKAEKENPFGKLRR